MQIHQILPIQVLLVACIGTFVSGPAHAVVFTVGSPVGPGQCTHGTIQSAINAAETSAGADTVRLTRSLTYEPEANSVTTSQEVTIEGGYATCTQAAADGQNTIVSGACGVTDPVFRITVNTGGIVHLRRLTISGGDEDGSGRGGGIYFRGNGVLEIRDSVISNNLAGNGGGIYAEGTGSDTELIIGANVVINNNTARYNGGGVVADQIEMSMLEVNSTLLGNTAAGLQGNGGYGGGLYVRAGNRPSYAHIGTGGPAGLGAAVNNTALYGGGVAVGGSGDDGDSVSESVLRLYTINAGYPGRISGNVASVAGGAIHIQSNGGSFVAQIAARAQLWNAVLDGNSAPDGAAVHLVGNDPPLNFPGFEGARLYINGSGWPQDAAPCSVGSVCGRIEGNIARTAGGSATTGAILRSTVYANVLIGDVGAANSPLANGGVAILGNRGGRLIDASGKFPLVAVRNSLIVSNQFTQELIRTNADGWTELRVRDSTIAGNTLGVTSVLSATNLAVVIDRSIVWQPGYTILQRNSGSQTVSYTIANEVVSLGGGSNATIADPRFIDPAHGDFSLRSASPAIDRSPQAGSSTQDVLGQPRVVDLPLPINVQGSRDIGAIERVDLQPLVLNADFDFSDLRLWTWYAGEWDGTQNVSGAPGSGSWKFAASGLTASSVVLGQQCIHLPGPGRYALNGRGKGGGSTLQTRDYAKLAWEFRREGTEDCSIGNANAVGEITIGSGTNWGTAGQPAQIDVGPADWSPTSSILVRLIVQDGGVNVGGSISGWFDGINLTLEPSDILFRNGFEPQ